MNGSTTGKRKHSPVTQDIESAYDTQEPETEQRKKTKTRRGNTAASSPLPPTSLHLPIALGGSHWRGQESFEHIVIIGDSYSKSSEGKTWVDHLKRRLRKENLNVSTEIHNFAFPGATVEDDLSKQMSRFFAAFPKQGSRHLPPALDPDSTTYFVFLGINDCGRTDSDDLEPIIEGIADAVHNFYVKAGARNFVLVDLPPIDRSPQAVNSGSSDEIAERVKTWNALLRAQATEFANESGQATVFLFSAHQVLSEVLDHPCDFDFSEDDPATDGGGIWKDDLHLAGDVHDVLAERLLASMVSQS